VCKIAVPGRVVLQALNNGVSRLPGAAGQFPQVSGMAFRVDLTAPPGDRVREVRVNGRPLDPNATYTVALPDFMLNGGDGYTMFANQPVLLTTETGASIASALERFIVSQGEVTPAVDGRIAIGP
jgi:5'-nucleotidase / UDP-sugar diphosphatase